MTAREPPNLFADRDVAQLRVPPHSIEAESSVLGGLLLDNGAWDRVGDLLTDSDFYRYEHRLIYAAIGGMVNACKPADVFTVLDQLQKTGKATEVGGLAYLNGLAQSVASASNIRRYAEIVRERSVLRRLISASDEIATAAFNTNGRPVDAILDEAERKIFKISSDENATIDEWESADQGVVRILDRINEAAAGGQVVQDWTPTGFREIDRRLDGGMRAGELIVIAARPSMGKSAMAQAIAEHVALAQGLDVGIFTMEMGRKQQWNRIMASASKIHLSRIRRPDWLKDYDWPAITEGVERLRSAGIWVNDRSSLNINQLRSAARSLRRRASKLGLLVVDYLSLMDGLDPRMLRTYQLAEITKGLKALGKELGIPILLLQQVDRGVEDRPDQMPKMRDLRDSGSIEQDADIIMFIHRDFQADKKLGAEWKVYARLAIAKLRDGEPGELPLHFAGEHLHFSDWPTDLEIPTSKVRTATPAKKAKDL
jgi:replicative DNA helicase